MQLTLNRNHSVEETYFDVEFVPLMLQDGSVGGLHNAPREITLRKLNDRRTQTLNRISALSGPLTSTTVYRHIADCFTTNSRDIPFVLLFNVEAEAEAEDGNHELALVASLGMPQGADLKPQRSKIHDQTGLMPYLRAAQMEIITLKLEAADGLIDWRQVRWGGHGEQSQYLTTIPLSSAGRIYGFLLVGNNPRRPIDSQYNQFMSDLQRHATAAIAATMGAEEVKERNQRLQDQLIESERQIRYMAQHSDIGMMQLALDGTLIWANEHYHAAINNEDESKPRQTFISEEELLEDDRDKAIDAWQLVLQGRKTEATELRLRRTYTPPVGASIPTTILLSAFHYMEMGQVKSVMACMTEVSRLKWAEPWQVQVAHDAKEVKRQQSEFTDAISHEVRNPLSAILQLADSITESLNGLEETVQGCTRRLEENVEAARTILSCAQHQKRIVDDVLTLSRMDFSSISLSPSSTRPEDLIQEALRIVEADAIASSIDLRTIPDRSLSEHIPWQVMVDPLRVTQVLINLWSNAIKFTKLEARRAITITCGATTLGEGQHLYLTFTVEDTGPGMTAEQMNRVFDRFEQATSKTSIKYGGSGLGLFISHSLTEKQGGAIGAGSTPGVGSTFAFYVKARRVSISYAQMSNGPHPAEGRRRSIVEGAKSLSITPATPPFKALKKTVKATPTSMFHILLVEDNLINQQILRKQLVETGCTVHVVNHGVEALAFLRTSSLWTENDGQGLNVDVILMDWEMPVMDGLTCTREIRALEKSGHFTTHPEVIAITANVRAEQVRIAEESGMDALVPKPFVVAELLEMITKRLKR